MRNEKIQRRPACILPLNYTNPSKMLTSSIYWSGPASRTDGAWHDWPCSTMPWMIWLAAIINSAELKHQDRRYYGRRGMNDSTPAALISASLIFSGQRRNGMLHSPPPPRGESQCTSLFLTFSLPTLTINPTKSPFFLTSQLLHTSSSLTSDGVFLGRKSVVHKKQEADNQWNMCRRAFVSKAWEFSTLKDWDLTNTAYKISSFTFLKYFFLQKQNMISRIFSCIQTLKLERGQTKQRGWKLCTRRKPQKR